jgi:hypothetical protein
LPSWNDTLLTLAEIAIAVLGFAGLIGVFARRRKLESFSEEFLKLRWLLDYGLFALVAALVPFLVMASGLSPASGWRVSSAALLAAYLIYAIPHRKMLIESAAMGRFATFTVVGDLVIVVVLLANATGFPIAAAAFPYLVAAFWYLFGAVAGFVQLVSLVWKDNDD